MNTFSLFISAMIFCVFLGVPLYIVLSSMQERLCFLRRRVIDLEIDLKQTQISLNESWIALIDAHEAKDKQL